jgi:hypothetical protein
VRGLNFNRPLFVKGIVQCALLSTCTRIFISGFFPFHSFKKKKIKKNALLSPQYIIILLFSNGALKQTLFFFDCAPGCRRVFFYVSPPPRCRRPRQPVPIDNHAPLSTFRRNIMEIFRPFYSHARLYNIIVITRKHCGDVSVSFTEQLSSNTRARARENNIIPIVVDVDRSVPTKT